jgi:hypothetical protein
VLEAIITLKAGEKSGRGTTSAVSIGVTLGRIEDALTSLRKEVHTLTKTVTEALSNKRRR